jgi:hypothetical protein
MHDKQRILKEAADLFGRKAIAEALNVSEALIEAWLKGDATFPDGHLLRLADAVVRLSAKETSKSR